MVPFRDNLSYKPDWKLLQRRSLGRLWRNGPKNHCGYLWWSCPAWRWGLQRKGPIPNVEPTNLSEQLALEEAAANEGVVIMRNLADAPRLEANYGDGEWVKV